VAGVVGSRRPFWFAAVRKIAREVGVGWKTCSRYLESLRELGLVVEVKTAKGSLYTAHGPRRAKLLTVPRVKVGTSFELIDESPPPAGEVEDLT
jgi:DNA-binding IscR family transcriptional regulator